MNDITRKMLDQWNLKWANSSWNQQPSGLSIYCRFIGNYGFQCHGGFGWKRIHTLDFATELQHNRKESGNWKTFWKHRQYAR